MLFGLLHRGEDLPRVIEKNQPLFGQRQAARGAMQQRGLQLALQPAQRTADAGTGLIQLFCCRSDRTGIHHRHPGA